MKMKLGALAVTLAVLSLASCATAGDKPDFKNVNAANSDCGQYPTNYEELIKAWASANLKDPESVRYGRISKPRKEYMIAELKPFFGYSVCANVNAKNSYGGYAGEKTFWFLIRDGRIARAQITEGFPGTMISQGHDVNCEDGT